MPFPILDAFVPNERFNLLFVSLRLIEHLVVSLDLNLSKSDTTKQMLDGLPSGNGPLIPCLNLVGLGHAMTWIFYRLETRQFRGCSLGSKVQVGLFTTI